MRRSGPGFEENLALPSGLPSPPAPASGEGRRCPAPRCGLNMLSNEDLPRRLLIFSFNKAGHASEMLSCVGGFIGGFFCLKIEK